MAALLKCLVSSFPNRSPLTLSWGSDASSSATSLPNWHLLTIALRVALTHCRRVKELSEGGGVRPFPLLCTTLATLVT